MSSWRKRAFNCSLYAAKKARDSGVSGTSRKTRTNSSRNSCPSCCQKPRMICVSDDTAPKRCRKSSSVSPSNESGTGWPSLNRSGRRNSYLRSVVLIRRRPLRVERNAFEGQRGKRLGRDESFAAGETFEGEAAGQVAQRAALGRTVGQGDDDHVRIIALPPASLKGRPPRRRWKRRRRGALGRAGPAPSASSRINTCRRSRP